MWLLSLLLCLIYRNGELRIVTLENMVSIFWRHYKSDKNHKKKNTHTYTEAETRLILHCVNINNRDVAAVFGVNPSKARYTA